VVYKKNQLQIKNGRVYVVRQSVMLWWQITRTSVLQRDHATAAWVSAGQI